MIFVWVFELNGNTLAFFQTNAILGFLAGFGIMAFSCLKILYLIYLQDTYPQRKDSTIWVRALSYCFIMVGGYLLLMLGITALVGSYGFWKFVQHNPLKLKE